MKFFRENKVFRIVWLLLAVHILNCSIDPPDLLPESVPEDLTVNEIESITELIAEDVLCIENAIEETDENDSEDGTSLDSKKVCSFFERKQLISVAKNNVVLRSEVKSDYNNLYAYQYSEVLNPPPEA